MDGFSQRGFDFGGALSLGEAVLIGRRFFQQSDDAFEDEESRDAPNDQQSQASSAAPEDPFLVAAALMDGPTDGWWLGWIIRRGVAEVA